MARRGSSSIGDGFREAGDVALRDDDAGLAVHHDLGQPAVFECDDRATCCRSFSRVQGAFRPRAAGRSAAGIAAARRGERRAR